MLGWNIDLDNKEVKEVFRELQGKVENMRPVMKEASETMYHVVTENFDTEGKRLDNGEWTDLSPGTKERRSKSEVRVRDKEGKHAKYKRGDKKGQYRTRQIKPSWPGKILQVSGQLEDSISADYDEFSAVVGTNDIRAATHQFGDPDRNIPGRSFLELTDGDLDKIENDALKWLEK
jgi:phage gpG-like protein